MPTFFVTLKFCKDTNKPRAKPNFICFCRARVSKTESKIIIIHCVTKFSLPTTPPVLPQNNSGKKKKSTQLLCKLKKHIIFALAKESTFFFNFEKSSAKTTHAKIAQLVEHNLAPQIQNPTLARNTKPRAILNIRENSSVGRARPCQGRGRGFESRFSLQSSESPQGPDENV